MSERSMMVALGKIRDRLIAAGRYECEVLDAIIISLTLDEGWPTCKVCAYLDILDLDDRT